MVVKTDSITVNNKTYNPARDCGVEVGDIITHIDSKKVSYTEDLSIIINEADGKPIKLSIIRDEKKISKTIMPVNSGDGCYKIGLWVRDSSAGIGTMTFYHEQSKAFGGLGHGICDVDTGEMLPIESGETTDAKITGYYKGKVGTAGELCGVLESKSSGKIVVNDGIYDTIGEYSYKVKYKNIVKEGKFIVEDIDASIFFCHAFCILILSSGFRFIAVTNISPKSSSLLISFAVISFNVLTHKSGRKTEDFSLVC